MTQSPGFRLADADGRVERPAAWVVGPMAVLGQAMCVQDRGSSAATGLERPVDWRSVATGVAIGFVASLLLWGVLELLRHTITGFADSSAEGAVALLAVPCYFVAGFFAARSESTAPGISGALAGAAVAVLGLLFSLVVWALFRDGPWLTGARAQHPALVLVGPILVGSAFGAVAGARARVRVRVSSGPRKNAADLHLVGARPLRRLVGFTIDFVVLSVAYRAVILPVCGNDPVVAVGPWLGVAFVYFAVPVLVWSKTLGDQFCRMRVVAGDQRLGFGRSSLRAVVIIGVIVLLNSYPVPLVDLAVVALLGLGVWRPPERRTLLELASGTTVIDE